MTRSLDDICAFPDPPLGKAVWPWIRSGPSAITTGAMDGLPRISIVTPSYNQGQYIEETIRSVLLQGYPNLEYIIIDGGSTDNTVEVIRKYEPWITYWVSEPDRGQSHAINKGFERATGDILGWLCSDDLLMPGALDLVGACFATHQDCYWLAGAAESVRLPEGTRSHYSAGTRGQLGFLAYWQYGVSGNSCPQPSTFWRKPLWEMAGQLREDNHLAMDYELWLEFERRAPLHVLDAVLSVSRIHDSCKSVSRRLEQGREMMSCAYRAARQRGMAPYQLTLAMARWLFPHRLRQIGANLRGRWWGGALYHLVCLPLDPFRVWFEKPRVHMLRR